MYNDPENPCALKCKAKESDLVVELAPKVLDGTRCYTESLDMCISGACQVGVRVPELIFISLDCTRILLFGNWLRFEVFITDTQDGFWISGYLEKNISSISLKEGSQAVFAI